ncbi:MAG: hypothetical protein M2R45_01950 [Verrucomicrobia subdivision 3 bacterium]|nr:hypothetical protein [Limisphaerales bacterium]MCS1416183.1 hypothetical protein [Limisphaerales bacterium]
MSAVLVPYPAYKPTDVEWLGDIPEHWYIKYAKRLFQKMERSDRESDGVVTCFRDGTVTLRKNRRELGFTESIKEIGYQGIRRGDLVIHSMDAFAGAIGVADSDGKGTPVYSVCKPGPQTNAWYYAYTLREMSRNKWIQALAKGIRERSSDFRYKDFGAQFVPFPPLPKQATIVRYLDHADRRIQRYIRAKEKLIALLEEQKQAIIHQAVTGQIDVRTGQPYPAYKPSGVEWLGDVPGHWDVRRLRNISDLRVSNVNKHSQSGEISIRLCNYVDVYKNDRIHTDMPFMEATATMNEIERFRLQSRDVLITKDSEVWNDIAVPALVQNAEDDIVSGYHLALLRPDTTTLLGEFLFRALQSRGVAHQLHVRANGVTRYGLSYSAIKSVQLPVPPLPEQNAIARFLDETTASIKRAIAHAQRQIELFREYRTRLIADVVTGKLDVREAADALPEFDPLADDDEMDDHFDAGDESDFDGREESAEVTGRLDVVTGKLDVREAADGLSELDPLAAADEMDGHFDAGDESDFDGREESVESQVDRVGVFFRGVHAQAWDVTQMAT